MSISEPQLTFPNQFMSFRARPGIFCIFRYILFISLYVISRSPSATKQLYSFQDTKYKRIVTKIPGQARNDKYRT
jgi:hypothetical protein